jgi:hypothetical protein
MQTLKTRLNPIKDEVLKVAETFGVFRAMDQFRVASYDRFKIWLKEATGNENFGLRPKIDLSSRQPLGDQLVQAFLLKVSQLENKNTELQQRVHFLEWQLAQGKAKEMNEAIAVLEVCKV